MSSDVVIRAEGLGKKYLIGHNAVPRERYTVLRDVMARTTKGLARSAVDMLRGRQLVDGDEVEEFWALKNLSFEVKRGEVLGIIGRNGAGKSTLLKVLSRITEPSAGRVILKGRVASLLELGTGFHPELTGRENIYLNGTILGMKRTDIDKTFDQIVDFAGIDTFLDTPVKRYSSGMQLRLGFSIAAHLKPEILVVDEVLAVGDAAFQQKCIARIEDVSSAGRTVLFVSHNMAAVISICTRALLLDLGTLKLDGRVTEITGEYMRTAQSSPAQPLISHRQQGFTDTPSHIVHAELTNVNGRPEHLFSIGDTIRIRVTIRNQSKRTATLCAVIIRTSTGVQVLHILSEDALQPISHLNGITTLTCTIPNCGLYPGDYLISLWLGRTAFEQLDLAEDILAFRIDQGALVRYGFDLSWRHGLYHCEAEWTLSDS